MSERGRRVTGVNALSRPPADAREPLLQVRGVSRTFPGVRALSDVDLDLHEGEVHAIVGENGAGKSTLVKIITGLEAPDAGSVIVGGDRYTSYTPAEAERAGVSTVPQELSVVPQLDVAHNVLLGRPPLARTGVGRLLRQVDRELLYQQAQEALALLDARVDVRAPAGSLGASEAQLVLIARALSRDMSILVMDEPTAALTPVERRDLFARVAALQARGVGVIYISHHLDEVFGIADRITVLRDGRRIVTVRKEDATVDEVIEQMLARPLDEMYPQVRAQPASPLLEVESLSRRGALDDVSLSVGAGEIVGVTGLIGAGKTELARALFGLDRRDDGEVRVDGVAVPVGSPTAAIDAGLGLVPEERKTQGLVMTLSVRANLVLALANARRSAAAVVKRGGLLSRAAADKTVDDYIARFRIRMRSTGQPVSSLSGGNQQKVVFAKWLATQPRLMILDEPTRGVDVGSKVEIYEAIATLAEEGVGVLLISSEPEEVIRMSHRVLVMRKGAIVAELDSGGTDTHTVMRYATAGA